MNKYTYEMTPRVNNVTNWLTFTFILATTITMVHTSVRCNYIEHEDKIFNISYHANKECPTDNICKKTFNITMIKIPPYSLSSKSVVEKSLATCCRKCAKYKIKNKLRNITELTDDAFKQSDIILPFLASLTQVELYGYHFIPVEEVTDAFYITERRGSPLFRSILQLYPLLIICFLLAVISGFVAWLLESSTNEEEFHSSFLIGWFEGIWWSFVTMTTVGYGDKSPKSFIGRVFAIIWILIGLIICGIITSTLTTEIIEANSPPPPDLTGHKVGSAKYRDYEQLIIGSHGGIRINAGGWDFYSNILLLIDKLQKKEIEGILMDRWSLVYFSYYMRPCYSSPKNFANYSSYPVEPEFVKAKIDYFLNETMRTELPFRTERLAYGILIKNLSDYKYFNPVIRDNRLRRKIAYEFEIREMIELDIKSAKKGSYYSTMNMLFSPKEVYFQTFLKVVALILILIVAFGLIYEYRKRELTLCSNAKGVEEKVKFDKHELYMGQATNNDLFT